MLTIRSEQMEIFAQRHEEQFINKLTEVAVTAFPEIAWAYGWVDGPERFRALVRKYVDEGYAYGLTYEYTLGRYTYYRLEFGGELLTDPDWQWLRDILNYETVPEEEKIRQIDSELYGGPIYPEVWDYE